MKLEQDEFSKYDITDDLVDYQPMDENMLTILKWLSGKKNIIQGIIATTSAFLALKGILSPEDATYINAINLLVFGSASYVSGKVLYNK
jgi:hypothetical protein